MCALLLGVLAGSLSAGCGGAAAPTTTLAAGDTGVDYPNIVYNLYGSLGKGELDVEAWKASEAGQKSVAEQRNFFLFKNEIDLAVLAYWEGLGMKKEIHDADDPALNGRATLRLPHLSLARPPSIPWCSTSSEPRG